MRSVAIGTFSDSERKVKCLQGFSFVPTRGTDNGRCSEASLRLSGCELRYMGVWVKPGGLVKRFVLLVCVLGACVAAPASALQPQHGIVSVDKRGTGDGTVTSSPGGIDCGQVCSSSFSVGEEGYETRTIALTATPFEGATFDGWEGCDDAIGATCQVDLGEGRSKSVIAFFGGSRPASYPLAVSRTAGGTVTSDPAGINCGSVCASPFARDTNVTLTATPDPGLRFSGWAGQWCGGTNPTCVVTMSKAKTVAAYFGDSPPPTEMPVIVSKSGSGTVASTPVGIACEPACSGSFTAGTTVTLTATPARGWTFGGWDGDCTGTGACVLAIDGPKAVTVAFREQPPETRALSVVTDGQGTVSSEPAGIDCGSTCSRPFLAGSNVTLRAAAARGWRFVQWRGACSGTSATCAVLIDLPKTATAVFMRRDVLAPSVRALRSSGRRGRAARLRYRVSDDSGSARVSVTVYRGRRALARIRRSHTAAGNRKVLFYYVTWRVPGKLAKRPLRFCVAATDPSGNNTRPSCALLRIS